MTVIVTSGSAYIDIDAFACAEAYSDYLLKSSVRSEVFFTPKMNLTIPPMIRSLTTKWKHSNYYTPNLNEDEFVIVDVSNPNYFDSIVNHNHIQAVFDHHHGFRKFWLLKSEVLSIIEPVGACATLIWEEIEKSGLQDKLDTVSYKLLLTAIISNSLNFQSQISSKRDIDAYDKISAYVHIEDDWTQTYYEQVSVNIFSDPISALRKDQKYLTLDGKDYWVGQIELWDASSLIDSTLTNEMIEFFGTTGRGFANIISISEGVNYLYTNSIETLDFLSSFLPGIALGDCLYKTKCLWLRKEIIKCISA